MNGTEFISDTATVILQLGLAIGVAVVLWCNRKSIIQSIWNKAEKSTGY